MLGTRMRVRRGAKLLDGYFTDPDERAWYWNIDCNTLDVRDVDTCILAQVFRSRHRFMPFTFALDELHINFSAARYGFVFSSDRNAWVRLIAKRRCKDQRHMLADHVTEYFSSLDTEKEPVHAR